jgi:predicted Mrr-cat superfamily restriction endonuclease
MKNEIVSNISSYDDLKLAKNRLRFEIKKQEDSFKDSPILKISTSLFGGGKHGNNIFKKPLSFSSINKESSSFIQDINLRSTAESILSTLLVSNKITRKYFIAYTVAKEMIPFTIQKFSELIKR